MGILRRPLQKSPHRSLDPLVSNGPRQYAKLLDYGLPPKS